MVLSTSLDKAAIGCNDKVLSKPYILFIFPKNQSLVITGPQETIIKLHKTPYSSG